jgi:predicted nucleotidyltransferase
MRATAKDKERLEAAAQRLVEQIKDLGAVKIILFGSLASGTISLFSDIDMIALFEGQTNSRDLTRWLYQNINTTEAIDIFAYNLKSFDKISNRPFIQKILKEGKVLYERHVS